MENQNKFQSDKKFNSFQEVSNEIKKYKTWKVILCILIPIVGIYQLWKNKLFLIGTRIVLTIFLLILISLGLNNPSNSINGTYTYEKDGYESKFKISGNSYTGSWKYCLNGDCGDESNVYGSVEDNTLYQESEYTKSSGSKGTEVGYIDSEGKLHYNTNMGTLTLEK